MNPFLWIGATGVVLLGLLYLLYITRKPNKKVRTIPKSDFRYAGPSEPRSAEIEFASPPARYTACIERRKPENAFAREFLKAAPFTRNFDVRVEDDYAPALNLILGAANTVNDSVTSIDSTPVDMSPTSTPTDDYTFSGGGGDFGGGGATGDF